MISLTIFTMAWLGFFSSLTDNVEAAQASADIPEPIRSTVNGLSVEQTVPPPSLDEAGRAIYEPYSVHHKSSRYQNAPIKNH